MNIKNYFTWMLAATMSLSFAACSDDDEDGANGGIGNITEVFPNGTLNSMSRTAYGSTENFISNITRDKEGRVVSMKYGSSETCKIEYTSANAVKVTFSDPDYPEDAFTRTFSLGGNGFINGGSYTDEDGTSSWTVGYDAQGHITSMVNTYKDDQGSGKNTLTITYDGNGDMTKYTMVEDETYNGQKETYTSNVTVAYTNSKVTKALDNKGGVMLFDQIFDIDLDEDICLYYAGLLGKGTAHLPVEVKSELKHTSSNGTETNSYTTNMNWTLNSNGFASSVAITYEYETETFNFNW